MSDKHVQGHVNSLFTVSALCQVPSADDENKQNYWLKDMWYSNKQCICTMLSLELI